ncbi:hypothetical protein SAMN05192552_10642 [Natrinema hispanicum]|uniref:Uncharacterized protein n=1 Tax=Natrinema hispanicum TaxID=392421 RepID=A0A1I0JB03_9EURY|nr:hypothetical protein BDK88_3481 [Natrinema hispanicum]SDD88227.1 hypothetical protein SAMN05192552_10642 [Natrinema hispanicum]SEU06454.1 hypothetical protein SAMN04488694_13516 [Natrinema hispanicum]
MSVVHVDCLPQSYSKPPVLDRLNTDVTEYYYVADLELDFDDDMIAVDDHDRQQRLMAAHDGDEWTIFEGPIDGPHALSKRGSVETANQVLVAALQWVAENDDM